MLLLLLPSLLWCCCLGISKSIRPIKLEIWGVDRCRLFAYSMVDTTVIPKPPTTVSWVMTDQWTDKRTYEILDEQTSELRYLSGTDLKGCPGKDVVKWVLVCSYLQFLCFFWYSCLLFDLPLVLWRCWLGGRKGIRPVKNWVVVCWRFYLSGARRRVAYGPADATATHCLLLQ